MGRVEGVRRLPGGGFAARFRPPAERFPQVALVAAMARTPRGLLDGWLAIPLSGQGDARVRTTPGSWITLRVGDRSFGPRRADAQGLAVIPVVVPPGVREAHHGFRPVDLKVPETPLVHAIADHARVHAHEVQHVRVFAYVVAPHGAARRGDVPAFEASRGSVSVAAREPGAFEALWTLPPGAAGEDRLAIRLPGAAASRTVLKLEAVAGPPATVAVSFDREALVAGADETAVVTARVLDAAGNAVDAPVELDVDGGDLSRPEPAGKGAVSARLAVAPRLGSREEAVVTARSPAAGISGSRGLRLLPGPAAEARFTPRDAVLQADGRREAVLRLAVRDRFGNPVPREPALAAERGEVLGVDPDGAGSWRVRYRAPAVPGRTQDRLAAEVGPARAGAALLLVPPRGVSILPTVGAMFDVRGRFLAPRAGLALELPAPALPLPTPLTAAWRLEVEGFGYGVDDVVFEGSRSERRIESDVLGGAALLGLAIQRPLMGGPELGASLGAGVVHARVRPDDGTERRGAAPALRAALGIAWPLRRATPFLEASILAAGDTPAGAFAAAGISAGLRLDLSEGAWRRSSSSTTSR